MKLPERFFGKDVSLFRSWWRSVQNYMDVYEPTMPTSLVKIRWVGSLLSEDALNWFLTRQTRNEVNRLTDTWSEFKEALVKEYTDELELDKDEEKLRALKYEGSISRYTAKLEEINSRVGMSGVTFRNMIKKAMSAEIMKMVYSRYGKVPTDDSDLLLAIKEAGKTVEEIKRSLGDRSKDKTDDKKPKDQEKKKDADQKRSEGRKAQDQGKGKGQEETQAKKEKKASLWKSGKEAFEGVPQEEVDTYKAEGSKCWRCGGDTHKMWDCFASKTKKGTTLPVHPSKQTASSSATKRKRSPEEESTVEEPVQKKEKIAAAVADPDTAMEQARIWEIETDCESDFQ